MIQKQPFKGGLIVVSTLLLGILGVASVGADAIPPQIQMNTGYSEFEPGIIKTTVIDNDEISKVTLYYRKPGDPYYNSIEMKHNENIYYRELNREFGVTGPVEYYILAQDGSGNETTEPVLNPETSPMATAMDGSVNQSEPEIMLSNPEPGTTLDSGDPILMVTFFQTGREIDFNTVRLIVDKRDRTRETDFAGNMLMWEPRRPLMEGVHEVELTVRDTNGDYIGPNIWTFTVKTKRELPLGAEGDFYLGLQRDDRSKGNDTIPLWNNKIDFGLTGQTGWVNWSAGVALSSEETSFLTSQKLVDRQPINRYFLEGRSRHFNLRFGDSNPSFSELSLKGVLVRGANLKFASNRFNAQFVKGYNKREIDQQIVLVAKDITQIDSETYRTADGDTIRITNYQEIIHDPVTLETRVYEFVPGTFKRNITAFQTDVTPIRNKHANWTLGINFMSAEDDTTSLNWRYDAAQETYVYGYKDSTFSTYYQPKKNWVGTVETSLKFNQNRSEIWAEFGGTLVTEDMFGKITDDIKNELPENIKDDVFRFNGSTQTSFDKKKLKDNIGKGVTDAIKSVYKVQLRSTVPIPKTSTSFIGELYRVPTHYYSLGNPQQKTDIGGYKFDVRSRFIRDQFTLTVGMDSYSDNLDDERKQYATVDPATLEGTSLKNLTKDTNIANVSLGFRPRKWAEVAPNIIIGYRTYTASNNLDLNVAANDTTSLIDTSTNTLMVNFGGTLPLATQSHTGTLSISNMSITDDRPLPKYELAESNNITVLFNVNSAMNTMPLTINTSIGQTANKAYRQISLAGGGYDRSAMTTDITMFNLSGSYKWFRDKRLRTTAGFGYIGSSNSEKDEFKIDNTKTTFRIEADYNITTVSSLGVMFKFVNFSDNANSDNNYTEPIIGLDLRSTF